MIGMTTCELLVRMADWLCVCVCVCVCVRACVRVCGMCGQQAWRTGARTRPRVQTHYNSASSRPKCGHARL